MSTVQRALLTGDAELRRGIELALERLGDDASEADVLTYAQDAARGMRQERERISKILSCSAAQTNYEIAKFLAFETDLPADEAIRALEALAAAGGEGRPM